MMIGGTEGGWHVLFGEWAELTEGVVELEFSACRQCRRVEMKLPDEVAPEETPLFTDPAPETPPTAGRAGLEPAAGSAAGSIPLN